MKPRSWRLQGVVEGQIRILDDLDVALDGKMLAGLVASGLTQLLQAPGGFGAAPPTAEFALVGGTGSCVRR